MQMMLAGLAHRQSSIAVIAFEKNVGSLWVLEKAINSKALLSHHLLYMSKLSLGNKNAY